MKAISIAFFILYTKITMIKEEKEIIKLDDGREITLTTGKLAKQAHGSVEVRMGKGKGSPEYYACRVKPGRILFEVDGVSDESYPWCFCFS